MQNTKVRLLAVLALLLFGFTHAQTIQLYHTVRGSGVVQELDAVTGNVLATNVGGITGGRGMAFSPLGGLYIARDFEVTRLNTAASTPATAVSIPGEVAHDVNFDVLGNMYVVTNLNVRVYDVGLTPTLTFAHNMTTTTGDGNGNKGFGIAVNPINGQIYVVAAQGLRRFGPATGLQIGATIAGSAFGMAGIAFTNSAFNGVLFYVGNVISGVDQIRVFDAGNNLLRTFFPSHIGNPIDLEVNPLNSDLYLFNTVVSNPANRFAANETQFATFSNAARPSQGSALGDFNGITLERGEIELEGEAIMEKVYLGWNSNESFADSEFEVQRFETQSWQTIATSRTNSAWDLDPQMGANLYRVAVLDELGQRRYSPAVEVKVFNPEFCAVWLDHANEALQVKLSADITNFEIQLLNLAGKVVLEKMQTGSQATLQTGQLPKGVYALRIKANGDTPELKTWVRKVLLW